MKAFPRDSLIAIGVLEADPPIVPWRPLRVVFGLLEDAAVHLWSVYQRTDMVVGYIRPASDFESAVAEHLATRLPAETHVGRQQMLVRTAVDRYEVRNLADIISLRRREERRVLCEAIEATVAGDIERAKTLWDRTILFGDTPPVALALRRGFAEDLSDDDSWRAEVIDEFVTAAPRIELDLVSKSLWWDELPAREHRNRWLERAVVAALQSDRPTDLTSLRPVPGHIFEAAASIVATHHLRLDPDLRLRHQLLARIVNGEPEAVESVMESIRVRLGAATREETLQALEQRIASTGDVGARVRLQAITRARVTDLIRYASLFERIEATLGQSDRIHLWRSGSASLKAIRLSGSFAAWQRGEYAADQLRIYWDLRGEPIGHLIGLLKSRIGLEVVAADLDAEEFDGCHVIDPAIPPLSYLRPSAAKHPGRVRFSLAKALGWRILNPDYRGAWLSRIPEPASIPVRSALERAANAFAAYLLAPRPQVRAATAGWELGTHHGYREAVRAVMGIFGLSFTAAFRHVANCWDRFPPSEWQSYIGHELEHSDAGRGFESDTVSVPEVPPGSDIRLERADGLSSRMARAVAAGFIDEGEAAQLVGTTTEIARRWFHAKVESASAETTPFE